MPEKESFATTKRLSVANTTVKTLEKEEPELILKSSNANESFSSLNHANLNLNREPSVIASQTIEQANNNSNNRLKPKSDEVNYLKAEISRLKGELKINNEAWEKKFDILKNK